MNLIDTYLSNNFTTRQQVAINSGINRTTFKNLINYPLEKWSMRYIFAIANWLNKKPEYVLKELIELEALLNEQK